MKMNPLISKKLKLILTLILAITVIIAVSPIIVFSQRPEYGAAPETITSKDGYPDSVILPYDKIPKGMVEKVAKLAENHTLYRDIKPTRFKSNVLIYEYLLDRPPLSAEITRLMKAGNYTVTSKGGGIFHGDDGKGMEGDFKQLYADGHKRVYYGEGRCNCRLVGTIKGKILLVLRYKQIGENGSPMMENKLNAYLKIDNKFFALLLKTFVPVLGGLADKKFGQFTDSAKIVSEAIASDPEKVYKYIEQTESINEAQKKEFAQLFLKK